MSAGQPAYQPPQRDGFLFLVCVIIAIGLIWILFGCEETKTVAPETSSKQDSITGTCPRCGQDICLYIYNIHGTQTYHRSKARDEKPEE